LITEPAFYFAAVPAVTLLGLSKGGFAGLGLLSLPLMALVVSPLDAAAIMLPILMVQDVVSVSSYRHTWDRRNLVMLLPGALVGILTGWLVASYVSEASVRIAVGLLGVGFAVYRLSLGNHAPATAPGRLAGHFWGWVCGVVSFIAHAGGPPFQVFTLPQRLPRDIFVGTGAIFFAVVNLVKVPPYIALGQFTRENLATSAALFPVAILSTMLGVWLVRRVRGDRFYTIVYVLLIGVGAKLIHDGVRSLF
jgi:uncharacterized membrane protein YfcA